MNASDLAREVGKAIVSAIPAASGPLQVIFENVFSAPIEKRKQAWLEQLADVVTEVQKRVEGLTPEKLAANEAFITVTMQASQVAIRNHQQEKSQALRNAILNSVLRRPKEDAELVIQAGVWAASQQSLNTPFQTFVANVISMTRLFAISRLKD